MIWSVVHADALNAVFQALNKKGIPWMVLRNYEGLPQQNRAKDIDLIFKKKDFSCARAVIEKSLRAQGFEFEEHTRFQCIWCFTFYSLKNELPCSIKIDLLDGFIWRGAEVVSFEELYSFKVAYENFFVPSPVYDGFMLWIKPLMTGGFVKDKYRNDIINIIRKYPSEFQSLIVKVFGKNLLAKMWPSLEAGNLDETVKFQSSMRSSAWKKAFLRSPVLTVSSAIDHFYKEILRRTRRPKASIIAVVGPDGAGKSTVIELLEKKIFELLIREPKDICIKHARPNIFPNIKKLLSGRNYREHEEKFTSPHRAQPAGTWSSFFRLIYYWSDYFVGYWLQIRKQCVAGKVFLFDRYFYDFIVDPHRSRIHLCDKVRFFFLNITPKPDCVVFLDCDSKIVYERKQELSLEEISRQMSAYRSLAQNDVRFIVVDASLPPSEIITVITRKLIQNSFGKIKI